MARVSLLPLTDLYRHEDRCAVMVGASIMVLSPVATALVAHLDHERTIADLTTALVQQFGAPADKPAEAHVETLIAQMVEAGIVKLVGNPT